MSKRNPIVYERLDAVPENVISQGTMLWNRTGSWRYMRPVYQRLTPACNNGCPAGNDIEGFIRLAGEGRFSEALEVIKNENPLPGICGRVCFHPCESACNRKEFDHAVAISAIERFIAQEAGSDVKPEKYSSPTSGKIAIVGSGPSSLSCAYHLARMGHKVTIYEAADKPGGILRYGIPAYRLPKDVLDAEIDDIVSLGVTIQCNTLVGKDISWKELDSFDAVFIGTGCHRERPLFKDKSDLKGLFPALDYLTLAARDKTSDFGKVTAVIGGGNSAIDAARTALRLKSKVTIYYQRSRNEMPAFEEEIQDAEKEGVAFMFQVQPVDIVTKWGRIRDLKLRKTVPGKPDESGRRRPEPVPGSEFTVRADTVVTAIGETPDFDILPEDLENDGWKLNVDEFGRTANDRIFAGGDAALDEHNIAEAIGSGKACACAIDAFLTGLDIGKMAEKICIGDTRRVSARKYLAARGMLADVPDVKRQVVTYNDLNTAYFYKKGRVKKEKLDIASRSGSFEEVCRSFSQKGIQAEADRCFHCGACTVCDNCYKFCPDVSVIKKPDSTGYDIDLDYCKGCGVCVNECPRAAMAMEEEI